ncbi:MerR family transcriptional regulator [Streptomyces sp. NPDC101225]|uniref:DNA polymerase III subunit beta family protein n=1 Tax=Streptomyces sp. NPDC101225 TaxID=3366135 RepID=UPI0038144944
MRSIGEMSRDSGLGVSALRFYDRTGVLVPARVDPVSGYRWYGRTQLAEARLLARLRRAGMSLADVRLVLAGWSGADDDLVRELLQAHLRRLERDLSDARAEFSTLQEQLARKENPLAPRPTTTARLTASAPELAAALDAVRFAVSADPELPMLGGVLFDADDQALRVVATDRYRMAVAYAGAGGHDGPAVRVIVPAPLADAMRALLGGEDSARLSVDGDRVTLETEDGQTAGRRLEHDFPDYRRLVQLPAGRRAFVDTAVFRKAVEDGPVREGDVRDQDGASCDLTVLKVSDDGAVVVCDDGDDDADQVALNRAFLLDALAAGDRDRLILEFGVPTAPVAIRRPDDEESFSLLMPVRLEH